MLRFIQESQLRQPHWHEVWQSASSLCGLNLNYNAIEHLCRAHLQQYVSECKVAPYSLPVLEALQKAQIPLGLVSNVTGPVDIFDLDLRKKGLAAFFQVVAWSSAVGYRKPDARIFQTALDGLGLPPGKQIFMIGDHEQADISGGKQMGFTTIKVVDSKKKEESAADYAIARPNFLDFIQELLNEREAG